MLGGAWVLAFVPVVELQWILPASSVPMFGSGLADCPVGFGAVTRPLAVVRGSGGAVKLPQRPPAPHFPSV